MNILVGDIGGTNARFGLIAIDGGRWELLCEQELRSDRFASLGDALAVFLTENPQARDCSRASIGVPGLVRNDRCEATNLPWVVERSELVRILETDRVSLLNDLEAAAWGLSVLGPNGICTLREGHPEATGNRVLVASGTGLGEAALFWDGQRHRPFATEGGHTDFGPADELQVELWRFLSQRHGHVSWERVGSGPGLVAIFQFLLHHHGHPEPKWLRFEMAEGDAPAAVSSRANDANWPLCRQALDLFLSLLGAEAGNFALKTLATGGVYLAGGIPLKLLPELMKSSFLTAFSAKGRFRPLMESIPVRIVVDDRLALWGAAVQALAQSGSVVVDATLPILPPSQPNEPT